MKRPRQQQRHQQPLLLVLFGLLAVAVGALPPPRTPSSAVPAGAAAFVAPATQIRPRLQPPRPRVLCSSMSESGGKNEGSFKGFGLLEWANKVVPQKAIVKSARYSWNLLWKTLMAELAPQSKDGGYVRPSYGFRGRISTATTGATAEFPWEPGRYHVYVGNACPWCHRATLTHALRGLDQSQLSYSYALDDPEKASRGGWAFENDPAAPNNQKYRDPVFGLNDLREVYDLLSPGYRGRCTAPVLVDRRARRVVNNESSDIIRMLNDLPPPEGKPDIDLYPPDLRSTIDELNAWVYEKINNGVYRSGFSTSQRAYEAAVGDVFSGLERVEAILSQQRFLAGDVITEADVRLFPTIVRFDAVYNSLFRCTRKRVADHPNLSNWLREVYQLPGVAATVDVPGLIRSYYGNLFPLNPSGICPTGPDEKDLRLMDHHDRAAGFPVPFEALGRGGPGGVFRLKSK